ncbi:MAG: choice-of-anchor tandem repeat GloVer-containing protein [Terriglobales bacterium]|jgi:uncharacterized repeat protein (TIGR03803 family)
MKSSILRKHQGTLLATTLLDRLFSLAMTAGIVFALCTAAAIPSPAQESEFHSLFSFDGTCKSGANPGFGNLVQGLDGSLYGTTEVCSGSGGTVFKFATTASKPTVLYVFCLKGGPCSDGAKPYAGLTLASNGNLYGTTYFGGASNYGTVFQITSAGKWTPVFSFSGANGEEPQAAPFQAKDGNLYGSTTSGGSDGVGTLYEMTTAGGDEVSVSFTGENGEIPYAPLVQGKNGNIYGTTSQVTSGNGAVIVILPKTGLKKTPLYTFQGVKNGGNPYGGLLQATDGNFYGTTSTGGANSQGGTIFSMTPAGKLKTIYSFCAKPNCTDGRNPLTSLIQANDGNLYGTTAFGGTNETSCNSGCGTIFSITTAGKLTTLYNFCGLANCADGSQPEGGLVQATNGTFYGTTFSGGTVGLGTVFSLSVEELKPFVKILPAWGTAGATAMILGDNLTGATKVTFNGAPAAFTVVSSTAIKATVPTGATTGTVAVDTPGGTLESNALFQVD